MLSRPCSWLTQALPEEPRLTQQGIAVGADQANKLARLILGNAGSLAMDCASVSFVATRLRSSLSLPMVSILLMYGHNL